MKDDAASPLHILRRPFVFLRHGEADWNVDQLCIGKLDRPLTARGYTQAEDARRHCAALDLSVIFHSPLSRAAETAARVARGRNVPLVADDGLMEACLGIKQGAREDVADDPFLRRWIDGHPIEQAETYVGLKRRVCGAVNRCLTRAPRDGVPLLVAHAGIYHALRDIMGMPVGRVYHCVPYAHHPEDAIGAADWRIEVAV